jgi:hypothetical protein
MTAPANVHAVARIRKLIQSIALIPLLDLLRRNERFASHNPHKILAKSGSITRYRRQGSI